MSTFRPNFGHDTAGFPGSRPGTHLRMICKSNSVSCARAAGRGGERRMQKRIDRGSGVDAADGSLGWRRVRGEAALSDVHRTVAVQGTSARRMAASRP